MKKTLLLFVTLLTITVINAQQAVDSEFTVGEFIYKVTGDGTTVTLLNKADETAVLTGAYVIPATISDGSFDYTINLIESAPFNDEAAITSVVVEGDTEIKLQAFRNLTSLTTVDVSAITSAKVGNSAFLNCTALKTVNFSNVSNIGTGIFKGCTALESIDLTNVPKIGNNMFTNCSSLTSISAPAATLIDNLAFYNCTSLTQIDMPVIETIKTGAFNSSGLTSITFPASLTTLDEFNYNMFKGCKALKTITVLSETPLVLTYTNGVSGESLFNHAETELNVTNLTVPAGAGATYFAADVWKDLTITEAAPLGLESQKEASFTVYPNPVADYLHFSSNDVYSVEVYNILGARVSSQNAVNSVDMTNLNKGVYIVKALNNETLNVSTVKVVKN